MDESHDMALTNQYQAEHPVTYFLDNLPVLLIALQPGFNKRKHTVSIDYNF